jgi:hypothetical protein
MWFSFYFPSSLAPLKYNTLISKDSVRTDTSFNRSGRAEMLTILMQNTSPLGLRIVKNCLIGSMAGKKLTPALALPSSSERPMSLSPVGL